MYIFTPPASSSRNRKIDDIRKQLQAGVDVDVMTSLWVFYMRKYRLAVLVDGRNMKKHEETIDIESWKYKFESSNY